MSLFACTIAVLLGTTGITSAEETIQFNRDIRPILSDKCFKCHGPDSRAREADLRLDIRENALALLSPDNPQTSELLSRIGSTDPDVLIDYCDRYQVTHLLVNARRYGVDYREKARLFPPFDEPVAELLAEVDLQDLVILQVTDPSTVVYHRPPWIVLDVQRVREAVNLTAGIPATADAESPPDR